MGMDGTQGGFPLLSRFLFFFYIKGQFLILFYFFLHCGPLTWTEVYYFECIISLLLEYLKKRKKLQKLIRIFLSTIKFYLMLNIGTVNELG